jgi:hypothetical protein
MAVIFILNIVPGETVSNIINLAKQEYTKNTYYPDMTVILKNFRFKEKKN